MTAPRYSIGIDLGTTNCVLAYVALDRPGGAPEVLPIPQRESAGTVAASLLLPSYYCYEQAAPERASPAPAVIGNYARAQLQALPGRVIHSAKSWLSHSGIDREARLLPFASEEVDADAKLSPVDASAAYLRYLRSAWDMAFATEDPALGFDRQRVTVTVPASFDEGAQALTRRAAERAGYPEGVRLLEEPQAAFYAWTAEVGSATQRFLQQLPALAEVDQTVLVCDIGGGTTDLSLFRIAAAPLEEPEIERIAVSDHLLLGGDNIDLAVAHTLERRLCPEGARLTRRQWQHLVPQAARLKEQLLGAEGAADEILRVSVPGEGSALFAGALTGALSRAELREVVLDGFFPLCEASARPKARSGLREIGLPYATDSAITRHLAAFLNGTEIDAVLCAGGTLTPAFLQERLLSLIEAWQERRPARLALADLSLAIARGAASYGSLKAYSKRRIRAGYARSVYLELERRGPQQSPVLVCILPRGFQEGGRVALGEHRFQLLLNRPARFTAYTSTHRAADRSGTRVALTEDEFHPLPPLYSTLTLDGEDFDPRKAGALKVAVQLEVELSPLGVLELALCDPERAQRWRLDFNLRAVSGQRPLMEAPGASDPGVSEECLARGIERIRHYFGKGQALEEKESVKGLVKGLERIFGAERMHWKLALLRSLWTPLYPGMTRRGRSLAHENAWLYLAGLALRPGYGAELDGWRMAQLWGCLRLGLHHKKERSAQSNWWMMWRRVAGGLSAEQQLQLYRAALPQFQRAPQEFVEGTRLLGALERVPQGSRLELARALIELVLKGKAAHQPHLYWTLARVLGRVPLYAAADAVLPAAVVEGFFEQVEARDWKRHDLAPLVAVFSNGARLTGTRGLDLHDRIRTRVVDKLKREGAKEAQWRVIEEHCEVSAEERDYLYGEELPVGLALIE